MEKGEIMQEVSPTVDYGMAICHCQIIIPPRDKQRMEAARGPRCVYAKMAKVKTSDGSLSELEGGVQAAHSTGLWKLTHYEDR